MFPILSYSVIFLLGTTLLIPEVSTLPSVTLKNLELRYQKLCQMDTQCNNCSIRVQEELLLQQDKMVQWQLDSIHQSFMMIDDDDQVSKSKVHQCEIPIFYDRKQFCCELWSAMDCRTRIATTKCRYFDLWRYRNNLNRWANDLMQFNVCTDFDYNSKDCQHRMEYEKQSEMIKEDPDWFFD